MPEHHTLSFASPYKSIVALQTVTLPPFVVLTGANGSGKTHALEALKNGHIRSSLVQDPSIEIALYDWNTIIPADTGMYVSAQEKINRSNLFNHVRQLRQQHLPQIQNAAAQQGIPPQHFSSWDRIRMLLDEQHLATIITDSARANTVRLTIHAQVQNAASNIRGQVFRGNDPLHKAAIRVLTLDPTSILFEDEASFYRRDQFLWGEVDPFQQEFAKLFTTYRDLQRSNLVLVGAQQRGIVDQPPLDDAEFQQRSLALT